jgi:hypothetical protein
MRRRRATALLAVLLPALVLLPGCGGGDNTNAGNTNAGNTNAGTNPRAKLDEALGKMAQASAGFNPPPPSMKLGEKVVLSFVISPKQTPRELEEGVRKETGPGNVETRTIRVSNDMEARLEGPGFHVEPMSPGTQPVSTLQETKWTWEVWPERAGKQTLYLYVSALEDYGDGAGVHRILISPYNPRTYVVTVPHPLGHYLPWLLLPALLSAGVAAWLWRRGKRGRRAAPNWFVPGAGESRIFLSYRREDTAGHVGRLRDALVERFGPGRVFMDLESIRGGDDFVEALEKAVASCAVVVAVIGRQWASAADGEGKRRLDNPNDFVRLEVEAALKRGVRVIPALVQGAEMPGADVLPAPLAKLARRNAVEISDSRWAFDVERLASVIEESLAGEPAGRAEASAPPG